MGAGVRGSHRWLRTGIAAGAALGTMAGTGFLPALAAAAPSPTAPALAGAAKGGAVIVVLKNQHPGLNMRIQASQLRADSRADQAAIVASIQASHGTNVIQLTAPSSVAATLSAAEVSDLRHDPAVARIIPDVPLRVAPASPAPAALVKNVARPGGPSARTCPFNPAAALRPLEEPEADSDIHASDGNPSAPDMGNSIAKESQ